MSPRHDSLMTDLRIFGAHPRRPGRFHGRGRGASCPASEPGAGMAAGLPTPLTTTREREDHAPAAHARLTVIVLRRSAGDHGDRLIASQRRGVRGGKRDRQSHLQMFATDKFRQCLFSRAEPERPVCRRGNHIESLSVSHRLELADAAAASFDDSHDARWDVEGGAQAQPARQPPARSSSPRGRI